MVTAGELLRDARRRHGLTQRQLAIRARTSQAAISRIERDIVSPTVETLAKLLRMMNEQLVFAAQTIAWGFDEALLRERLALTPDERVRSMSELPRRPHVHRGGALTNIRFTWRGKATDDELVTLTRSHGGTAQAGWWDRIRSHSLGWVTARTTAGTLVGFVNVAWDGCDHAFLIDTKVRPDHQRRGVGTELVRIASRHAEEAGCEWMEVDFDDHLAPFYYEACGFVPTPAGLLHFPGVRSADRI